MPGKRREVVEGRSTADVLLAQAAQREKWSRQDARSAGDYRLPPGMRAELRLSAAKWKAEADRLLEEALREEAAVAKDPDATRFAIGVPEYKQLGRALYSYRAGKGGSVVSRRQGKRRSR